MYVLIESYLDLGRRLIPPPTRRGSAAASASSGDSSPLSAGVRSSTLCRQIHYQMLSLWKYRQSIVYSSGPNPNPNHHTYTTMRNFYLCDDCPPGIDVSQATFEYRRSGGHCEHDGRQDGQLVVHVSALVHVPRLEGHLLHGDKHHNIIVQKSNMGLLFHNQYQAAHAHSKGHSIHVDIGIGLQSECIRRTVALFPVGSGTIAVQVSEELRGELVSIQRHANVHFPTSSVANVLHQCCETRVGIDDAVGDIHGLRVWGSERSCVVDEVAHSQQRKASHLKAMCREKL